jgi:hypothetical protein
MYKLQYRYKKVNSRWSRWSNESSHECQWEAIKALGEHVGRFEVFSCRVINEANKTLAEYNFKKEA